MKSSWICCAAASLLLAGAVGTLASPRSPGERDAVELTNFRLSPAYSQWLLGPIARIADGEEIERYLKLADDAAAAAFIEEFWSRRDRPWALKPSDRPRNRFEERAQVADAIYRDGTHRGRYTDRGTVFILHGEPQDVRYATSTLPGNPAVEIWAYPKSAPPGLDGRRPKRRYHFVRRGDLTVEDPAAGQRLFKERRPD